MQRRRINQIGLKPPQHVSGRTNTEQVELTDDVNACCGLGRKLTLVTKAHFVLKVGSKMQNFA